MNTGKAGNTEHTGYSGIQREYRQYRKYWIKDTEYRIRDKIDTFIPVLVYIYYVIFISST